VDTNTQGAFWLIVLFGLYFLPTIVARLRRAENPNPTFIINLFLGWTLLGWVIALAMGAGAKTKDRAAAPPPDPVRIADITKLQRSTARVAGRHPVALYAKPDLGQKAQASLAPGTLVDAGQRRGVFIYVSIGAIGGWAQADLIELGEFVAEPVATTKTCPQCAEQVQVAAKICRFCRFEFIPTTADAGT
jgi:hypothetical protein